MNRQHVATRARIVARRLLDSRDPLLPKPQTHQEMVSLVETLAEEPRKHGVFLTAADLRCLRLFHTWIKASWKEKSPN